MSKLRMNQAIASALADAMADDPTVVLFGEDIAAAGGPFKTSEGLQARFGSRVRDTPISEMAFTGAAVGAAMHGLKPVIEIMFMEFLGVALDQLVTEGALMRYLSRSAYQVPMVLRASVGSGTGFGCQHSGTQQNWVVGVPGLSVVMPSDSHTAYGLLRAAIADPDPVVVLEPRMLYGVRGEVDLSTAREIQIGQSRRLREGTEVTIVAAGRMVGVALASAEQLAQHGGVSAEVIDLFSLHPWDEAAVLESVAKTGRLVVVEESSLGTGWSQAVVSRVVEECFTQLKAPPLRVGAPDVPVPFTKELEGRYAPTVDEVVLRVRHLITHNALLRPWWAREEITA